MSDFSDRQPWQTQHRVVEMNSPWVKLICDRLQEENGKLLDYWRVEKADSAIVLILQKQQLIFPQPMYRPGLAETTLDFPGGRIPAGHEPATAIEPILKRELGITRTEIQQIKPINSKGWAINSSFSNQKLYGFVAQLYANVRIPQQFLGATYPATSEGIASLLQELTCLQCRALLLEWLYQESRQHKQ